MCENGSQFSISTAVHSTVKNLAHSPIQHSFTSQNVKARPCWTLTQELDWEWLSDVATTHQNLPCPTGVFKSPSRNYFLSLAPWNGLYIPDWFQSSLGFRLATENQQTQRCLDGYLIIFAVGCTFAWQHYTVGGAVSPNAVQVSVWKDGTLLYWVEFQYRIN